VQTSCSLDCSRSDKSPTIWSISPSVKTTASMVEPRIAPFIGPNSGNDMICVQMSGDALSKIHRFSPTLTATDDCVRLSSKWIFCLTAWQFLQPQFHCGVPPPADEPKMWMRIISHALRSSDNFFYSALRITLLYDLNGCLRIL